MPCRMTSSALLAFGEHAVLQLVDGFGIFRRLRLGLLLVVEALVAARIKAGERELLSAHRRLELLCKCLLCQPCSIPFKSLANAATAASTI